ncbi:MAG: Hint domain-containing protein [Pseudomonadota bacterium]
MAKYDLWALGSASVTVSGGGQLDGVTQGDGSHLVGLQITLDNNNWENIDVKDNERFFDDNDGGQRLRGGQTFDGESYGNNTRVEAEYQIVLVDPNTGIEYRAIALNFVNSNPSYATIEGIAFVDVFPPVGVALTVVSASEGPGDFGQDRVHSDDLAVPCFTAGTLIETPLGPRLVEDLVVGDLVTTLDHGAQPLTWVGASPLTSWRIALSPHLRPIVITAHAFGLNHPKRDMRVSPQHRILIEGWRAEVLFGEPEVLIAAKHLVDGVKVRTSENLAPVTYIHLQCAQHEVLISDGLPTESFNPGPSIIGALPDAAREELRQLFPDHNLMTQAPFEMARPVVTAREARALVA